MDTVPVLIPCASIQDPAYFASRVAGMDPRSMVKNNARFITSSEPIEADNQQGRLQKEILRELRQHRGKMSYRELCLNLDYSRYGIDVWNRAYRTMLPYGDDEGIIAEWHEQRTPGKRAIRMVGLIKFDDE